MENIEEISSKENDENYDEVKDKQKIQFLINPTSRSRIILDIIVLTSILLNITTVPLVTLFYSTPYDNLSVLIIAILTDIICFVDIILTFFKSKYNEIINFALLPIKSKTLFS